MCLLKKKSKKNFKWECFKHDYMLKEIIQRGERDREVVILDERRDSQ